MKYNCKKNIIWILLFLSTISYSQINITSWRAFEKNPELIKTQRIDYDNFIKNTYPDSIPIALKSEYKAYLRYMYFWQRRLGEDSNGKLSYTPYYQAAKNLLQNPICLSDQLANWSIIEPGQTYVQNEGLVTEVLYDQDNPQEPIISSNHGGLWKYDSYYERWNNITDSDNLRMPGISATEIVRNPFNHDNLFASTGSGIHQVNYGMGIIESNDNGDTWHIMANFPQDNAPRVVKIVIDPNDNNASNGINLYAISEEKIYYSNNSGNNWIELSNQPNINYLSELYDLQIDSEGSLLLSTYYDYGYNAQCFKYKNNTWTEMISNSPSRELQRTKFTKPVNGLVFALCDMNETIAGVETLLELKLKNDQYSRVLIMAILGKFLMMCFQVPTQNAKSFTHLKQTIYT